MIGNFTNPAVLFFSLSTLFELLCVVLYAFVFPKLPIVKYYRSKAASEGSQTVSADLAAAGIQTSLREVQFLFFSISQGTALLLRFSFFIRLICVFFRQLKN